MAKEIKLGNQLVGEGHPTYIIAEIGINHNGDLNIAKRMIHAAHYAHVNAVKFQKRTPKICVPLEEQSKMRETPWGYMSYLEYREHVEFGEEDYGEINALCNELGIDWFASVWDEAAIDFLEPFNPIAYKVPSASLTDHSLLGKLLATGRPIVLSTGMSTMEQIRASVKLIGDMDRLIITHSTSAYPCSPDELNLRMIPTLTKEFDCPIGYSGHEVGLIPSVVSVSLGACLVERHFTLDRAMWGTDQAASVEPQGMEKLVKYIRVTEEALGDGVKRVYDDELPSLQKLRRIK
ncbi:MAG: N-acetylneuraminate synthase family protein [Flexilinea sp.]